jgi:hypothetical protein
MYHNQHHKSRKFPIHFTPLNKDLQAFNTFNSETKEKAAFITFELFIQQTT